jgi:hypothetical protein
MKFGIWEVLCRFQGYIEALGSQGGELQGIQARMQDCRDTLELWERRYKRLYVENAVLNRLIN